MERSHIEVHGGCGGFSVDGIHGFASVAHLRRMAQTLVDGICRQGHRRKHDSQKRSQHPPPVPVGETRGFHEDIIRPRRNRQSVHIPPDIFGKLRYGRIAFRWFIGAGFADDRLEIRIDLPVEKMFHRLQFVVDDSVHQLFIAFPPDRKLKGHDLLKDQPQCENIGAFIALFSAQGFRRKITRSPRHIMRQGR